MKNNTTLKVNPEIQELVAQRVLEAAETEERAMSGNLSASKLGWPLQWQMLNKLRVPSKKHDEFTLRKFQRGKDVEDRIMAYLATTKDKMQVPVVYRGVTGIMDVLMSYPVEVKSVTNAAFKFKQKEGASRSHRLQGELYAKALGYDKVGIAYVASDDYRILCFEYKVGDEVDAIIDRYEAQVALGTVPEFVPEEPWQAKEMYNPYPDWMKLSKEEIATKLTSMGVVVPVELPLVPQSTDGAFYSIDDGNGPGKGENGDWSNQD